MGIVIIFHTVGSAAKGALSVFSRPLESVKPERECPSCRQVNGLRRRQASAHLAFLPSTIIWQGRAAVFLPGFLFRDPSPFLSEDHLRSR